MANFNNDLATYYFHQGTNYRSYEYLGCNLVGCDNGEYVYAFRTWAPNAFGVSLVSDFVGWDTPVSLNRITDSGIWELIYRSDVSLEKCAYKFRIASDSGVFNKGDPYARFSRGKDDGASLIFTDNSFVWHDSAWLRKRRRTVTTRDGEYLAAPINIYEVHLGSFIRHEEDNRYYSYREFADVIAPYLKYMGYTHIEFLPLAEHPFDGSWGYQVCAFYAPTSRFGDPNDFKYLVDTLHSAGIGVIMDWVPAHFPKDAWGLYEYDGKPLYEYQGRDRQESRSWGTRFFDLGREEIQSFLISNAMYFLREFHIDGLRVDAVASMLYLDYDRDAGEWIPNVNGGRENLEAIAFFKKLNSVIFAEFSDVLMIAEESTAFGKITKPVSDGGLGFNLKWNMGWANDFYEYVMTDPYFRKYKHSALNFPLMYAFTENYVMPISHDEVVHGKLSFVNKMYGSYEDKFLQMRSALLLMMSYPGKKLTFMGTEFAQFREWDFDNSLEWFMLDYPKHQSMREYCAALNAFYLKHSEMWEIDFSPRGFEWIHADMSDENVVAYKRRNIKGEELIFIISFSGSGVSVPIMTSRTRKLKVVFDTNGSFSPDNMHRRDNADTAVTYVNLPPFSSVVLKQINNNKNKKIELKESKNVL